MKKNGFAILFFTVFTCFLYAQNHMDIMTTMTGEHNFANMGLAMTTLDWNGDGYDDLIVNSQNWDPRGFTPSYPPFPYGKLYVYFGGPGFDNIPEMEIPGHHEIEFCHTTAMCNAGDMNGDGIDDLALFRATMYEDGNDQHYDSQLCVFYGGADPDTIPDYVLTFPREEWDVASYNEVQCLGDIDHDGFSDIGYAIGHADFYSPYNFGIIYGGSMENTIFSNIGNRQDWGDIRGVGDINADGISDFCIGYLNGTLSNNEHRVVLYYGSTSRIFSDSLVIADTPLLYNAYSYPVGNINMDGISDFASSFAYSNAKLYFGCSDFDGSQNETITPSYNGDTAGMGFAHGDVNGNGTDDLMGTFCSQADGYGDAYLWIGGVPMNGTSDLHITPDVNHNMEMFGWCLTMGDYNGDGYCDAAISAPFDYAGWPYPGEVIVYAGNPQLNDPTPIADNTNTPEISKLQLYPNPLQPSKSNLNVSFSGLTPLPPSSRGVISFDIYNIRGQKVKSYIITAEQTKAGAASFNLHDLPTGVYICKFHDESHFLHHKLTIIR